MDRKNTVVQSNTEHSGNDPLTAYPRKKENEIEIVQPVGIFQRAVMILFSDLMGVIHHWFLVLGAD